MIERLNYILWLLHIRMFSVSFSFFFFWTHWEWNESLKNFHQNLLAFIRIENNKFIWLAITLFANFGSTSIFSIFRWFISSSLRLHEILRCFYFRTPEAHRWTWTLNVEHKQWQLLKRYTIDRKSTEWFIRFSERLDKLLSLPAICAWNTATTYELNTHQSMNWRSRRIGNWVEVEYHAGFVCMWLCECECKQKKFHLIKVYYWWSLIILLTDNGNLINFEPFFSGKYFLQPNNKNWYNQTAFNIDIDKYQFASPSTNWKEKNVDSTSQKISKYHVLAQHDIVGWRR